MAEKTKRAVSHTPAPREHATLDHWVGKDQHVATGVSTDPAMEYVPRSGAKKGVRRTSPDEHSTPIV